MVLSCKLNLDTISFFLLLGGISIFRITSLYYLVLVCVRNYYYYYFFCLRICHVDGVILTVGPLNLWLSGPALLVFHIKLSYYTKPKQKIIIIISQFYYNFIINALFLLKKLFITENLKIST